MTLTNKQGKGYGQASITGGISQKTKAVFVSF